VTIPRLNDRDAVRILESGGVLLMPTDTLPGLHARADRPEAVARVAELKGRSGGKPLLVLAASPAAAETVTGPLVPRQLAYARRCWPGPFSLIMPAAPGLDSLVTAGGATVAVRVPNRPDLVALLEAAGYPLVSTSANRAGEEPARSVAEAASRFGDGVDGVWGPTGDGEMAAGQPSALVDLTVWPPRLVRPGPIPPPDAECGDLDLDCGGS